MSVHYRVVNPPKGAMEVFYAKVAPIITGVGASVVIVGALRSVRTRLLRAGAVA